MSKRPLPPQASVAHPGDGGRLVAPAASRNAAALGDLLARVAPARGRALELASGTGQHAAAFAARFPALSWQPTEIDPERRASIDAYCADLPNVAPALELDATRPGWSADHAGQDLILLVNLLHLISAPEARTLMAEAASALAPGGLLVIYGPFMRAGELTSEGDRRFHAALRAQDPAIGYKNDLEVLDLGVAQGLEVVDTVEMPANNLSLVWQR